MAKKITPEYTSEIDISSPEKTLVLLNDAINRLGWKVSYIGLNGIIAYTKSIFSLFGEKITVRFENDKAFFKSECVGSQLWNWERNEDNITGLINACNNIAKRTPDETIQKMILNLVLQSPTHEIKPFDIIPTSSQKKESNAFSIFIPTEGYFITPILLNVNILIFLVMVISGMNILNADNASLIKWGANLKPITLDGQWWRLMSCCFLHTGLIHIMMNMFALVCVGFLLEPLIGKLRFLSAYLLTGFGSSLFSLWYNDLVISAGASGAIFGLFGVFIAMLTTNLIEKSARKLLLIPIAFFVIFNLVNGLRAGIDGAAHFGGFITGLFIGYAFYPSLKTYTDNRSKIITVSVLTYLFIFSGAIVYRYIPYKYHNIPSASVGSYSGQVIGTYQKKMQKFVNLESMAMEVSRKINHCSREELLEEIKSRSLFYWNENIEVIKEADSLKIPESLHLKDRKLIEYCNLRIQSLNLLYKAIDEKTDKYEAEAKMVNAKIENTLKEEKSISVKFRVNKPAL
ncbi:MAG: rhomboid family intramembrane serine protease [Bacteroidetes bacterium]|nr:rhomboid family intramembrane serine protease [Bacteroidota bacterium]